MEQHQTQAPPAASAATAPVRAQWTPAKQRIFIMALLETGSVARAARAAGMSRSSAHRLRTRLAGTTFDRLWKHALAVHVQRMADPFAPDPLGGPPQADAPAAHARGRGGARQTRP